MSRVNLRSFPVFFAMCLCLLSAALLGAAHGEEPKRATYEQEEQNWLAQNGEAGIRKVQRQLNEQGYCVGVPDGQIGPRTRAAVVAFKRNEPLFVGKEDTSHFITPGFAATVAFAGSFGGVSSKCAVRYGLRQLAGTYARAGVAKDGTPVIARFEFLPGGKFKFDLTKGNETLANAQGNVRIQRDGVAILQPMFGMGLPAKKRLFRMLIVSEETLVDLDDRVKYRHQ